MTNNLHDFEKNFQQNKRLSDLTTFGIGGPARYFIEIRSIEVMQSILILCAQEKLPYFILGKGSNCLFDDKGVNGLVIHNKIDFITYPSEGLVHAGAGTSFSLLGVQTARQGWAGLEFASGIPGSVGGAVYMNAGANGTETCHSLASVDFIDENGKLITLNRQSLTFKYRHSPFQNMRGAIVSATFALEKLPSARQKQIEIVNQRKKTQPLSEKSAGCIFRNPLNAYAGALIEKSELKEMSIGDAQVSHIHANFIINKGTASSQDVIQLINLIKKRVKEQTGIELESEVRVIPVSLDNNI